LKIAVVGTGYVGLVTGTCFAETGNEVTCIDIDAAKVAKMKLGQVPIYEPDLENLFKENIQSKRLNFTTSLRDGISDAAVIFLALPTPAGEDGSADLSYILGVADGLGPLLEQYTVVIDKSTVPVGTAERVKKHIAKTAKVDFDVVSNPEFLREGFAVTDFLKPDRIVIGSGSRKAQKIVENLYAPFVRQGNPIFFMDERSAEMTKYAANSFLATKISFMNEIANLCELVGANADSVRLGIGADDRIGKRFLFPGIGYGGSCFPKDVMALSKIAHENNYDFKIIEAVNDVNNRQKLVLVNKINKYYGNNVKGKVFALWGLAFKPDTDDIREAAALEIVKKLTDLGARIVAYDPKAISNAKAKLSKLKGISFANDEYSALQNADALIIATEWSTFRAPDFMRMAKMLKEKVIFDGRNLYSLDEMKQENFYYSSIGRQVVDHD